MYELKKEIKVKLALTEKQITEFFKVQVTDPDERFGRYWKLGEKNRGYGVEYFKEEVVIKHDDSRTIRNILSGIQLQTGYPNILKDNPVWDEEMEGAYENNLPYGLICTLRVEYNMINEELALYLRIANLD